MKTCGLVIAGGRSSRMQGQNKLWLELGGEALVVRAARRLSAQVDDVAINMSLENTSKIPPQYEILPDEEGLVSQGHQGPLMGVLAGLKWAKASDPRSTYLATVPADAPFYPIDLVSVLLNVSDDITLIRTSFIEGYPEPLFTLWPVTVLDALHDFLSKEADRKVMNFIRRQNWQKVAVEQYKPVQFLNVNKPDDWEAAYKIYEGGDYE